MTGPQIVDKLGNRWFICCPCCIFERQTRRVVPPYAILLSGNKSMQKCLHLAVGISFAGFLRHSITKYHNNPALCQRA